MVRKISDNLAEWKNRTRRHPLVLRGARQVGKTFLVRELGKTFAHYLELNFEEDETLSALFASKAPKTICELLEARFDVPLVDGESLLFLDELQSAEPFVLESLRYFYEKRPGLHVVAAGSLLEFLLDADERKSRKENFSMPVGRIEYMFVAPMDFEEFLLAVGKEKFVGTVPVLRVPSLLRFKEKADSHYTYRNGGHAGRVTLPGGCTVAVFGRNIAKCLRVAAGKMSNIEPK